MKISFYLKNKSSIYISVFIKGKRIALPSGQRIKNEKNWNGKSVIGNEPFKENINLILSSHLSKLRKIESDAVLEGIEITLEYVKEKFSEKKEKQTRIPTLIKLEEELELSSDFLEMYHKFIEDTRNGLRVTVKGKKMGKDAVQTHTATLKHLIDFSNKKKFSLRFKNINEKFYKSFCDYLWDDLCHYDNTVGKYIRNLKAFLTWSEKTNEHKKKYFRVLAEDKDIVVLTPEQLNLLIDTEVTKDRVIEYFKGKNRVIEKESIDETTHMLARTKDILVMGCTTTLRVSDLLKLSVEQNLIVSNNYKIRVGKTVKTGKDVLIDLPPYAQSIIDKYIIKSNRILPQISDQKFNENLKKLGEYMGWDSIKVPITRTKRFEAVTQIVPLSSLLTSHVMRRTGITTLLIAGMNEYAVKRISGHTKNSKSFSKYIEFSEQYINEEFQSAWENIRNRGYGKTPMKAS